MQQKDLIQNQTKHVKYEAINLAENIPGLYSNPPLPTGSIFQVPQVGSWNRNGTEPYT